MGSSGEHERTTSGRPIEQYLPEGTDSIDALGYQLAEYVSERSSRRGFLAKVGRLTFSALGVVLVTQVLPYGRDIATADSYGCGTWWLCGLCGPQCGCGNCSGNVGDCPGCACSGGGWVACCQGPAGSEAQYRYRDCFSHGNQQQGPCSQAKINNCQDCQSCCRGQYPGGGPYYSGCNGSFMCTKVNFVQSC